MKICVFSDSHGRAEHMLAAIRREKPDLCFFLGDGEKDLEQVHEAFPALRVFAVRGNCDLRSSLSRFLDCAVGGVRIFAVHGHLYDVDHDPSLETLSRAARAVGASVALFGHTHRRLLMKNGELTLLNPGSIGASAEPGYGLLQIEDGTVRAECRTI